MHTFGCLCRVEGRRGKELWRDFCTDRVVLCRILAVFGENFADFGVDFLFRKHASDEKVNAKFFCGVDFFQPSMGFLRRFETNRLKTSNLSNSLKTRLFSTKSFFVQNF